MVSGFAGGLNWWFRVVCGWLCTQPIPFGRWPSFVPALAGPPSPQGKALRCTVYHKKVQHYKFVPRNGWCYYNKRYYFSDLYRVPRAFPEGEGGPARAGTNEGYLPLLSRSVLSQHPTLRNHQFNPFGEAKLHERPAAIDPSCNNPTPSPGRHQLLQPSSQPLHG